MKFIATILIYIGFFFLGFSTVLMWQRYNPTRLSFKNYESKKITSSHKIYPVRLRIIELNLDLPLVPATYKNGYWESTNHGASYLLNSPSPGTKGNSIIYGHNWNNLLGPLHNAQVGYTVEIILSDNTRSQFKIDALGIVSPDNTEILKSSDDTRITIYTCTGFLDRQRLVVAAIQK